MHRLEPMNVIRFIGSTELIALARYGRVDPIHKIWHSGFGNGVKKDKPCLWFFPFDDDEWTHPEYRLRYCSGIVSEEHIIVKGKPKTFFICLHLNLPREDLIEDRQTYADPDGSFFDTFLDTEYLLHRPYRRDEVSKIEIYHRPNIGEYQLATEMTIEQALILPNRWEDIISEPAERGGHKGEVFQVTPLQT